MISSEVQRTLVKSPPELWSELSDPAALARHLGELGEIRIVRVEPEKVVEWAAEHTTGTVSIKASGWGTKVTLSVERELVAPTDIQAEPDNAGAADPADVGEPSDAADPIDGIQTGDAAEPIDTLQAGDAAKPPDTLQAIDAAEPEVVEIGATVGIEPASNEPEQEPAAGLPEPAAAATSASAVTAAAPEAQAEAPRVGFFARLFRRRRSSGEAVETQSEAVTPTPTPTPEPAGAFAAVSEALAQEATDSHAFSDPPAPATLADEPEQDEQAEPLQPEHETHAERSADIAAELLAAEEVAAEEVAAEEVTAVLAAVLDRLGAAHHRPFSRS